MAILSLFSHFFFSATTIYKLIAISNVFVQILCFPPILQHSRKMCHVSHLKDFYIAVLFSLFPLIRFYCSNKKNNHGFFLFHFWRKAESSWAVGILRKFRWQAHFFRLYISKFTPELNKRVIILSSLSKTFAGRVQKHTTNVDKYLCNLFSLFLSLSLSRFFHTVGGGKQLFRFPLTCIVEKMSVVSDVGTWMGDNWRKISILLCFVRYSRNKNMCSSLSGAWSTLTWNEFSVGKKWAKTEINGFGCHLRFFVLW